MTIGVMFVVLFTILGTLCFDKALGKAFPVELHTNGQEVGPDDSIWGHDIKVNFKTSRREFAGSNGTVFISFHGSRATSETLPLHTGFVAGALNSVILTLNREIGALEYVKLMTESRDGWLLSSLWCDIGPSTYYFEKNSLYLDYPDITHVAVEEGTLDVLYEPQAPTKDTPEMEEGTIGVPLVTLRVVDRVDTFRDPFDNFEEFRLDMDP